MNGVSWLAPLLGIVLAPILPGIINRVKANFAGRKGTPLLQLYWDLFKLVRKGSVYSRTAGWVLRAGPLVGLAAALTILFLLPLGAVPGPVSFQGDFLFLIYLLGLARFLTVLAALDTGSSFEGMGASREVTFSALAEPALFLSLAAVASQTDSLSLTAMTSGMAAKAWQGAGPILVLVAASLLAVFLAENARIPFDDPNTHLELTMIHEAMVLDHGGPDLAMIFYGSALKMWILGSILVGVLLPIDSGNALLDLALFLAGLAGVAIVTGVIESGFARLRMPRVPHLLAGAGVLSALALLLVLR